MKLYFLLFISVVSAAPLVDRNLVASRSPSDNHLEVCKAPSATTTLKVITHLNVCLQFDLESRPLRQATTAPGAGVLI